MSIITVQTLSPFFITNFLKSIIPAPRIARSTNLGSSIASNPGGPDSNLGEANGNKSPDTIKFPLSREDLRLFEKQAEKTFEFVDPKESIRILEDDPDNRVLEAAVEGKCSYVVTGDKELLDLKEFKKIKIVTATEFVKSIN